MAKPICLLALLALHLLPSVAAFSAANGNLRTPFGSHPMSRTSRRTPCPGIDNGRMPGVIAELTGHRKAGMLFLSENSPVSGGEGGSDRLNEGTQDALNGYRKASLLLGLASAVLLLYDAIPNASNGGSLRVLMATQRSLGSLQRRWSLATQWGGAAGFGLASYAFWLMGESQANPWTPEGTDQHPVDPNLRLRLQRGLLLFCLVGLPAVPGEAGWWLWLGSTGVGGPSAESVASAATTLTMETGAPAAMATAKTMGVLLLVLMTLGRLVGAATLIRDLYSGPDGVNAPSGGISWKQIPVRIGESLRKLWVVKDAKKSLFYRNTLLMVLFGAFSRGMEGLFGLRYRTALAKSWSNVDISLQFSGMARMVLLSSLVYSLKKGSEILVKDEESVDSSESSATEAETETSKRADSIGDSKGAKLMRADPTRRVYIRLNWMVAAWSLMVCAGQCIGSASMVGAGGVGLQVSLRNTEFLLLAIIFGLKGYREYRLSER